ncbi:MAG TPA: DUF4349 domain-containing protein [bacterium]|nr:DUF4349 domain-containing protein [bacterium]
MREKIWKGFGIFGMICLGLIIFSVLFKGLFVSFTRKNVPVYELEKGIIGTPLPAGVGTGKEKVTKEEGNLLPETTSRMIIKSGWLNLVVKDIVDTAQKISKFAQERGGWVVSSNISQSEKILSGSITVRVPAESFDESMEYFKSLAERVSNERTQAQDITEEYVDLQSRLKNLEAAESQLLEIMERSGTISEVLQVQRELMNVREQIERIKGRMQYLEQSVKMSSITVNLALSEELLPIPPAEKWRPKYVLLQTWKNVLDFWKSFSYLLIKIVVWAQVWIPFGIICVLIWKYWKKRKIKKG